MVKMTQNTQTLACKIMCFYENNLTNGASFVFVLPLIACECNRNGMSLAAVIIRVWSLY